MKKAIKILKITLISLISLVVAIFITRCIGQAINNQTPKNGINESMYVDINNDKQWISIYGENEDNPVLLYLHGGPGSSTSHIDYSFTRKWADIYTVVTWDQRNCGKSYNADSNVTLTYDLLMQDGKEITEFIIDYMKVDKITILGHSWGSYFGANLVYEYPEYYDAFIGVGQLVDMVDNEIAFKEVATTWVKDDEEGIKLLNQLTPENMTLEHINAKNSLMEKYGYSINYNKSNYNVLSSCFFNPYYSLKDWISFFNYYPCDYLEFMLSEEFNKFSLKNKLDYKVPFLNINGNKDYQTNYFLAEEYFDSINAPYKDLRIMDDTTHGLLETKSNEFSKILHEMIKIKDS